MKRSKKIVFAALSFVLLLIAFGTWYKITYAMDIAKAFELNTPNQNKNLLIATQGSLFKDALVDEVIDRYGDESYYIKVIDISALTSIDPANYNALLIVHTWENWKPPASVRLFIDRTKRYEQKIIVFTTSGDGSYSMDDVDAITGESNMEDIANSAKKITMRLDSLLN